MDLGIYSAFPGALRLPPDGNRNPFSAAGFCRDCSIPAAFLAEGFGGALQRLPAYQTKKKKEKKKQADVILSSPGTSTLAVFEVGCLRTVKEWGRTGPPRLAGLVARRRVDVPARTALSLGWLCRCVLRDPETKIARGEFGTGVEVDDQALGKPRGAS